MQSNTDEVMPLEIIRNIDNTSIMIFNNENVFLNKHKIPMFVTIGKDLVLRPTKFFHCSRCSEVFSTRESANDHDCSHTYLIDQAKANEVFITWICISNEIKNFALKIQYEFLSQIRNQYVSILIDGARRYFQSYEGVMLYFNHDIHYFAIQTIDNRRILDIFCSTTFWSCLY